MIEAYAYAITRDAHLAEDVFEEVALVVGERGEAPAPPGFLPWLKEVVRRKSLELRRRRARVGLSLSDEAVANVAASLPSRRCRRTRARCGARTTSSPAGPARRAASTTAGA